MRCSRCGSTNIFISRTSVVKRKRGIGTWMYWLLGIWLIDLVIWMVAFIPRLLIGVVRPKSYKTEIHTEAICQSCGNVWRVE